MNALSRTLLAAVDKLAGIGPVTNGPKPRTEPAAPAPQPPSTGLYEASAPERPGSGERLSKAALSELRPVIRRTPPDLLLHVPFPTPAQEQKFVERIDVCGDLSIAQI